VNRRGFLSRLEAASAVAVAGSLGLSLSGCIGFHYVNATVSGSLLRVRRDDFGHDPFVLVDVPGVPLPLYLYRHSDGSITAVSTRCMHLGCQVEPAVGHLVCPCHGSEYANDGSILKGPTQLPLRRFQTRVDGNDVVVDLATGDAS
jgi:cytochrome b6-f complex iron-sulfur subunit